MVSDRIGLQRTLAWMVITAGALLAPACGGTAPEESANASDSRSGSSEHLDDAEATGTFKTDEAISSNWDCFGRNGRLLARVGIWWGDRPEDGTWACNEWHKPECDAAGGCVASGNLLSSPHQCEAAKQIDGCSLNWNDPTSVAYKEIFREACNAHDTCYSAPWDRIADYWAGFNKCNDNFWKDMNAICDRSKDPLGCTIVASVWGDAMNFDPGRSIFSGSFAHDQGWMDANCLR